MYYCKNCGLLLPPNADACPQCGAPRAAEPPRAAQNTPAAPQYAAPAAPAAPAPMSTAAALGWLLLFGIPLVGLIAALVCAFVPSLENPARRTLARAWLLRTVIVFGAVFVLLLIAGIGVASLLAVSTPYYY